MPPKQSQHSNPSERLLGLFILLLFSRKPYSLSQLAVMFRCSKQSILRHLEQMQARREIDLDVRIEDRQKWVGVRTPDRAPNIVLDPANLEYLYICRDVVAHLLPAAVRNELEQTLSMTSAALLPKGADGHIGDGVAVSMTKGAIDYSPLQGTLESIFQAIRSRRKVKLVYKSASTRATKTLIVSPLKIVAYREGLYLQGQIEADAAMSGRLLPIQRIKKLEVLKERFPEALQQNATVPTNFGIMMGEPFEVRVRASDSAATYVSERQWSTGQKIRQLSGGGIELHFHATSRPEIIAWVLGFGGEVELLEPKDLREELGERLKRMSGVYASSARPRRTGKD